MQHPDIAIVGAGIIGLSLALELDRRGAHVTVLERDFALSHASIAAAGMLAAADPENPPHLRLLSDLSVALYPGFVAHIESLAGIATPFQTSRTLQSHPSFSGLEDVAISPQNTTVIPGLRPGTHPFTLLAEHSIDPRQLATSLHAAVRHTSIRLLEQTPFIAAAETSHGLRITTAHGSLDTRRLVHTRGAWSIAPVVPRKGQMLSVVLPPSVELREVIRTPEIYIVPRTLGPRAGHALIGATVEDAGFDTTTRLADLAHLRALAAQLLPYLVDEDLCPVSDQWAGLRPATPDALPLLGPLPSSPNQFIASGHYRNGILLAPATAQVMAQIVSGEPPAVDLSYFAPSRFFSSGNIAHEHRYSHPSP